MGGAGVVTWNSGSASFGGVSSLREIAAGAQIAALLGTEMRQCATGTDACKGTAAQHDLRWIPNEWGGAAGVSLLDRRKLRCGLLGLAVPRRPDRGKIGLGDRYVVVQVVQKACMTCRHRGR